MPELPLDDGAALVARLDRPRFVELDCDPCGVCWCNEYVIPIQSVCTLENDCFTLICCVLLVVDCGVEKEACDSVTCCVKIRRSRIGRGCVGCCLDDERGYALGSETYPAVEPWDSGGCLDSYVLRQAAHIAGGGGSDRLLAGCPEAT